MDANQGRGFLDGAKAIWHEKTGQGRNLFCRFRLRVDLKDTPTKAMLHVFADTTYQLYVNGVYIQSGSVRFDPQRPVYDSHDLSKLLGIGQNVVAVQVNYVGHKTFNTMPAQAGFAAWGCIETAGDASSVDVTTGSAAWKASAADAYGYAAKASLFLKAADYYIQRLDEPDWSATDFDDKGWSEGTVLSNQQAWETPEPRTIPFMSGQPVPVERVLHVLPLDQSERIYAFSVSMPHVNEIHEPDRYSKFMAMTTWIYAPEDKVVTAGLYYQDTWMNGEWIPPGLPSADKSMRLNHRIPLRKGWNHYFCKIDAMQDVIHHYLALPKDCGLIVSAVRDPASPIRFRRTPVMSQEDYESSFKNKQLPYSPDDRLEEAGGWIDALDDECGASPVMDSGWDTYGEPFETLTAESLADHTFRLQDYPEGFSLLLDLGLTWLVLPRVVLEGAGGAVIDLTYGEHLNQDRKHLRHYHWYGLGDRAIADKHRDRLDWRLTQPRGFRYLQLTVRNPVEDVTLKQLDLRSAAYPVEQIGAFRCSDPLLEQIWEMGVRTEAANMEDAYTDCVTRERGMYIRDTIIQYHNNLAVFGDHALMRRCLELIAQSPDETGKFRAVYPNTGDYTIADFALNALEGFWVYYEQTGDIGLIDMYWSAMMQNLAWFHELADEREDLLLDAEWDVKRGIEAHYGGFHGDLGIAEGYMDNTGIHCMFSCTYLIALRCAARLAVALGKTKDRAELNRRIAILDPAIRERFWDDERGCYSDNLEKTSHSLHASLFAARAGVLTEEQLDPVRHHVSNDLRSVFVNGYGPEDGVYVSPSFAFYIFEGLYEIGLADVAERMMKQGWGWFLQQGLKQTPEYYDLNLSLCHAWSACPTYFLSRHVLGVQLPQAGNPDEVLIHVQTSDVTEAEGVVPHPSGTIEVKWHTDEAGSRVFDYIRVPGGMKATLVE